MADGRVSALSRQAISVNSASFPNEQYMLGGLLVSLGDFTNSLVQSSEIEVLSKASTLLMALLSLEHQWHFCQKERI